MYSMTCGVVYMLAMILSHVSITLVMGCNANQGDIRRHLGNHTQEPYDTAVSGRRHNKEVVGDKSADTRPFRPTNPTQEPPETTVSGRRYTEVVEKQVPPYNDFRCKKNESHYHCEFTSTENQGIVMYQISEDNTIIQMYENKEVETTLHLNFNFEFFDNNTSLKIKTNSLQKPQTIWSHKIIGTAKDIREASRDVKILNYKENTSFEFSCKVYSKPYKSLGYTSYVHVGIINITDKKITIHNTTYVKKLNKEDNGTIFWCMEYTFTWVKTPRETIVTRFVSNKTLLIYQSHRSTTTRLPDTTYYVITVIPSICAVVAVVVVIFAIKTCCWKKNDRSARPLPPIPLQPIKPAPYTQYYENVALRGQCDLEIQALEEAHYEEIM